MDPLIVYTPDEAPHLVGVLVHQRETVLLTTEEATRVASNLLGAVDGALD